MPETGVQDGVGKRRGKMVGTSRSEKPGAQYLQSGDGYGCVRNGERELSSIRESIKRVERRDLIKIDPPRDVIMTAIETIKKHKADIKKRYGVKKIGIFGSYVRGEQTETSDVDLLVEFDEPTFDNFMDLLFFLEELFGKDVDLITTSGMSPYIRPNIEKEVVWCE